VAISGQHGLKGLGRITHVWASDARVDEGLSECKGRGKDELGKDVEAGEPVLIERLITYKT
jgi:hypothetical protein